MIVHVTSAHDHSVAVLVIFPDLFLQLSEHTLFGHAYFCLEGGKQLMEVHPTLLFRHVPLFLDAPTEGRRRGSNEGWVTLGGGLGKARGTVPGWEAREEQSNQDN